MTNHRRQNDIGLRIVQTQGEGVKLRQRLDVAVAEVVATPSPVDLVDQTVQGLDVGVRVRVLEVVEDELTPTPVLHERQDRFEMLLHFGGQQIQPGLVSPFGLSPVLALVDVVEPFLAGHCGANGRVVRQQALEGVLALLGQVLRPGGEQPDLPLQGDAPLVGEFGLDGLANALDCQIGVSDDMKLVDHDHGAPEEPLIDRLVGPVHVLGDDFDLLPTIKRVEVGFEVQQAPGRLQVEHLAGLDVAHHEPRRSLNNLLVHAENARQFKGVVFEPLGGVRMEDASRQRLLNTIEQAGISECARDGVDRELVSETDGHQPVRVDARQVFHQGHLAAFAPVALTIDPQEHGLALDRMVLELYGPLAVLADLRIRTGAGWGLRISQFGMDDQGTIALLVAEVHEPLEPQQVDTFQHVTPLNLERRNRAPAQVNGQLLEAA